MGFHRLIVLDKVNVKRSCEAWGLGAVRELVLIKGYRSMYLVSLYVAYVTI